MEEAEDKLAFLASTSLADMAMETITPSKRGNWINQVENEWDDLLPIADKKTKAAKGKTQERAIFKLFSLGVKTNRDEWTTAIGAAELEEISKELVAGYQKQLKSLPARTTISNVSDLISYEIKWTRKLKSLLVKRKSLTWTKSAIVESQFRPWTKKFTYFDRPFNEDWYQLDKVKPLHQSANILVSGAPVSKAFHTLATNSLWHHDTIEKATGLSRYRYSASGDKIDNITDWALNKFQARYGKAKKDGITKDAIFYYCYAVLHDPVYRETYAINLKREFPRIPFYNDFHQWAEWGEALMALHIGYEEVEPWPLERLDVASKRAEGSTPKPILKSVQPEDSKATGSIRIDADTSLAGVPASAWRYKLGNRTAIDWVLDQHKEKKPRDPAIREKFDTYRFADHKERVIDLLARVTRVSVETVAITEAMAALPRETEDI